MRRLPDDVAYPPNIGPNTPLRLKKAAELAYPDGSMTASGLRGEAKKGRLVIERVAGKDYTTLGAIEEMRGKCRVRLKAHTCSSEETGQTADRQPGSSGTGLTDAERIAARDSALMRLSEKKMKPSPNISQTNTTHGPKADVIPMTR
jgi:hypothetical protein